MNNRHFILFANLPLIYGRVPKVANSSIKAALTRFLQRTPEEGGRTTSDSFWVKSTHGETSMITPLKARGLRQTHFSFSFVRNPFDRIVSAYNNKLIENSEISNAMKQMGLSTGMDFDRFIDALCGCDDEEMDVHFMPQAAILCHKDKIVPKFVGHLESMPRDWRKLRIRMKAEGLPTLKSLPEKNVRRSDKADLREYFNQASRIDKIYDRYRQDFEFFYSGLSVDQLLSDGDIVIPPLQRGRKSPVSDSEMVPSA